MKAFLIALATVAVLAIAAVLVGPSFVDWNSQKALIAEEARRITGRDLTIEGDVALTLLPAPALSAKGVRLANLADGTAPAMVELEALRVNVAFMPLLQGRVQVVSVSLVEPKILLEILPDGRRNWDFTQPKSAKAGGQDEQQSASAPQSQDNRGPSDFTVQVDSFAIQDGVVVYRDARSGQEERVEDLNGRLVAESLDGPFAVEGRARLRGVETAFNFAVGRMVGSGATPLNFELGLPEAKATTSFSGSLSLNPHPVGLRGRLKGEGENLSTVLAALLQPADGLPAILANSFALDATLSADRDEASLAEVALGLGATSLSGNAQLRFGPPLDVALKLNVPRLDLDELLTATAEQPESETGASSDSTEQAPEEESSEQATATTRDETNLDLTDTLAELEGNVTLSVDALIYRQQVVRQLRVNLGMAERQVVVNQALALLPGGSDLSVTGALDLGGDEPRFAGHVEAAADNLRGVFDWLGVDVTTVPQDRLRKASLSSRVQATPQEITLSEIDLRFDVTRAAGGIVVAVRDRLGVGVGLSVDSLNLDAYLPETPAAAPQVQAEESPSTAEAETGEGAGPEDPAAETSGARPGALALFDANMNLRLGTLRWHDQTAKDVHIEGTLQNGKLTLHNASLADLAGSSLSYAGEIDGLGGRPTIDGLVELNVGDPARLARAFGIDGGDIERLGPFNATANLEGSADDLGINSKLAILDGRLDVSGRVQALASPPQFQLQVEAAHPRPIELAESLGGPLDLPPGLGPLDVKALLSGTLQTTDVSELDGRLGPLAMTGGLVVDNSGAGPTLRNLALTVAARDDDMARLGKILGLDEGRAEGLGGVDVTAKLMGDLQQLQMREISGTIGPLGLAGSLDADVSAAPAKVGDVNLNVHLRHPDLARLSRQLGGPSLDSRLGGIDMTGHVMGNAQVIRLDKLAGKLGESEISGQASADLSGAKPKFSADLETGELPLDLLLAAGETTGGSGGAGASGGGSLSPRWSAAPLDLSALQSFNGDLKLKSRALLLDDLRLQQSVVHASLNEGRIDLQRLTGNIYKGSLAITGIARTANGVNADFTVAASDVEIGDLLRAATDSQRVSGPVNLDAKLKTRGQSEAELVSSLTGSGDISGSLLLSAKVEEQLGAALLSVLGQKVREVRGIGDATNTLFAAFAGAPADLTGSFSVEDGVVRTVDTRLQGRDAHALTHANIDLPAWVINSSTDVFRGNESDPYLTASLSGQLDEPNVRVSGVPLRQNKKAPEPSKQKPAVEQPNDQDPEPLDPKKLLEGLLKGLGN